MFHNILDCIDKEKVVNALHYAGKTFKSHTCINVGVVKRSVVAVAVVFKLRENKVPNFNKSVALAAYAAVGTAAALVLASVEVNFGAGAAWT